MELEVLCEFAEVAKQKSFSRAAEELHLSQPSLSKHIMALEKELGLQLFERTSRRVTLSRAGQRLLPCVEEVRELYGKMLSLAREERAIGTGRVSIVSIPVMAQYGITEAISDFVRLYPESVPEVRERESRDIEGALLSGDCDLAFTRDLESGELLESLPFREDRLVAVLSRRHPLADRSSVSLSDLRDEEFLLLDSGTSLYQQCTQLCAAAGFRPKLRYTGNRPENLLALAAGGMGVALLMEGHVTENAEVSVLSLIPTVESRVCLVRRRDAVHTPQAEAFWNFIAARS